MWPYNEDDHMEIGDTGWVAIGEGLWRNLKNGHVIDDMGNEFDSNGYVVNKPDE